MEANKLDFIRSYAKRLSHKDGVSPADWDEVKPHLLLLLDFYVDYATTHDLPIVITSIIRPKIRGISKTDIHADKRAFDTSVHGWTKKQISDLVKSANESLKIGAISMSDKIEHEAVYEDGISAGSAPHIHWQVRPMLDS